MRIIIHFVQSVAYYWQVKLTKDHALRQRTKHRRWL